MQIVNLNLKFYSRTPNFRRQKLYSSIPFHFRPIFSLISHSFTQLLYPFYSNYLSINALQASEIYTFIQLKLYYIPSNLLVDTAINFCP